jgi:hypothetical protein
MKLDFWNNPIVVSAFRVRYRRGGFTSGLAPYLVALAAGGVGLEYYQDKLYFHWTQIYYPLLMGLQFLMCGIMASSATVSSMRSEVVNRTLDFQRIAALSPRQILFGKLLGEPAIAYLLAMSTFPLAMWCFLAGGVAFDVMILMYVNLATTLILCGATGLIGRLELPVGQAIGVFISIWALGMPIPLFVGIGRQNIWSIAIPLFGIDIPYILLLPPVQLLLAYVCFRIMERQLVSPLLPLISKPMAYLILTGVDLIVAALLFNLSPLGWVRPLTLAVTERSGLFFLVHFAVSFLLMLGMTSWRETIYSWVWRFRRRRPYLSDLWLGDRSENILSMTTFAVLGLVNLALLVLLPAYWTDGVDALRPAFPVLIAMAITFTVLILTWGTIHQWMILIGGRLANPFSLILFIMAMTVPVVGTFKKETEWLVSFSPGRHFGYWMGASEPEFSYLILVVLYVAVFILFRYLIHKRMRQLESWIDIKLRLMGVPETAPKGGS